MIREETHRLWEASVLQALCEFVSIPSLSPDFDANWQETGHLVRAAELIAGWATARGVEGIRSELCTLEEGSSPEGTPMLLIEAPATHEAEGTVVVYGHLDKQPPLGGWRAGLGAFSPVREGDLLYGRGAVDDGYAAFAAVTALELLDAAGVARPRVVVLVEASEESGSPDLSAHLDALAPRLGVPDLVVCLDSGSLTYDRLWLTSSLRGNLIATVRVDVLEEGVHSGNAGGVVPTSFRILRRLLDRVEDASTGELRLRALHGAIPEAATEAIPQGWTARASYPVVGDLAFTGADETERLVRLAWHPVLTVTGADGLPSIKEGGNVLRPWTALKLSLRLPPTVDAGAAAEALVGALSAEPPSTAKVTVRVESAASGWAAPALDQWVAEAFAGASEEIYEAPYGTLGEGGSIPFLGMLSSRYPGVPLVATGALGPSSNAHGPNECLHLPTGEAMTVALARLIEAAGRRSRE